MSEIVEKYVKYVKETIDRFSKDSDLIYEDDIRPQELNRALGSYMTVNLGLLAEYQRAKVELYDLKKAYGNWYDPKFIEICKKFNDIKGITLKEKEAEVRNLYNEEYNKFQDDIELAENKERFLLRYIELYGKFDNVLTCLSNNSRQEMRSLSLENRMNFNPKVVEENRIRSRFPK
jgi:hypothetical protein